MVSASRKEYLKRYHRNNYIQRRGEFFANKHCVDCGATENLELDHVDPATKISMAPSLDIGVVVDADSALLCIQR